MLLNQLACNSTPKGLYRRKICGDNDRMRNTPPTYIWQAPTWPTWRYDLPLLADLLTQVSHAQGALLGRLTDVGLALQSEASLAVLTEDVVQTSAIEGEALNVASVRSSVARRLGVDIGALAPVDRHVEGVVEMVLDATARAHSAVTAERLFGWHAALFSTGYSGMSRIQTGGWRGDAQGPMQVVSGPRQTGSCHCTCVSKPHICHGAVPCAAPTNDRNAC